jgi:hypothetical protein
MAGLFIYSISRFNTINMELKKYIEATTKIIIPSIDHLQLVEYKGRELDFAYGMEEYHTSFKRMFKELIRLIWR